MDSSILKQLNETHGGNDCGWEVEVRGHVAAFLDDVRYDNYPWSSFRINVLPEASRICPQFDDAGFWTVDVVFRNRTIAFVGVLVVSNPPLDATGRLRVRGPINLPITEDKVSG